MCDTDGSPDSIDGASATAADAGGMDRNAPSTDVQGGGCLSGAGTGKGGVQTQAGGTQRPPNTVTPRPRTCAPR